jgi:hypothetical protein
LESISRCCGNKWKTGRSFGGEELRLAKDGEKEMPPAELHAVFTLQFDVHAPQTQENVRRVSRALDAA